ncbi:MAG TPA: ComEC/Rec2 family competence protein, partial [Pyrinomonadaceae bacterium]
MKKNPHSRLFSLYPLTQLASAYLAGVVVSHSITIKLLLPINACAVCSVGALALFARRKLKAAGLTILSAMFFAGLLLAIIEQRTTPTDSVKRFLDEGMIDPQKQVLLTGVLDSPPEFARDRLHLTLRVESLVAGGTEGKTSGVVALLATFRTATSEQEYRQLNLHYGSRLQVKTTLNRSNAYRNPGVSTLTEYLDRKNYEATGVVKSPTAIAVTGEVRVFKPLAWLYAWRESLQRRIDQNFSADTAGILDAAVLGNRYNLSRSTEERFRDAGTFHVLVISGLHISFLGGLVFLIARRLTRRRILQFVISSLIVWGYT